MNFASSIYKACVFIALIFITNFLQAQPVNNIVGDVVMPAPNAAALGKYGDIPVSYATGVPNIGIPLYVVTEGPLQVPLSLSYHASGIRVAETASWVGLGWSLNAGGMITRTVMGLVDDDPTTGYYYNGQDVLNDNQTLYDISNNTLDGEPDIFSFNIGGYSGKFLFDKDKKCHLIPKQDVKIEVEEIVNNISTSNSLFQGFTITTPDGLKYHFGNIPGTPLPTGLVTYPGVETTSFGNHPSNFQTYNSSWYLVRVESADELYHIDFEYEAQYYSYKNLSSCQRVRYYCSEQTVNDIESCPGDLDTELGLYLNKQNIGGKVLTRIVSTTSVIDFHSTTDREDLDEFHFENPNNSKARSLDSIEINSGPICEKWIFDYDYFLDTPYTNRSEYKRLRLNQVHRKSCLGEIVENPYIFAYENPDNLPNRLSLATDHWGFYNGTETTNLDQLNIPPTEIWGYSIGNSDRETDADKVKTGLLNKILYPTGGATFFKFEANTSDELKTETQFVIEDMEIFDLSCDGSDEVIEIVSLTAEQIQNGMYRLYVWSSDPGPCGVDVARVKIEVREVSTNNLVGIDEVQFVPTPTHTEKEVTLPIDEIGVFTEGVQYKFTLTIYNGGGQFDLWAEVPDVRYNRTVGGVRIKEIRSSPTNSPTPVGTDIIKSYEYTDANDPSISSGDLYQLPDYGYEFPVQVIGWPDLYYYVAMYRSTSYAPLGAYDGYHVYYTRVVENHSSNGRKIMQFKLKNNENPPLNFPIPPLLADLKGGELDQEEVEKEGGILLQSTSYEEVPVNYEDLPGNFIAMFSIATNCLNPQAPMMFKAKDYTVRTARYQIQTVEKELDGVLTTTETFYDPADRFTFPVATELTNSDGKIHRTESTYIHDYTECAYVQTDMIERNMIASPIQVVKKVDGVIVSGSKTLYKYFDATGNYIACTSPTSGTFPRPHEYFNYEMTFTGAPGSWELAGTIVDYDTGYPSTFTKTNWLPEAYEWQNGLIKKRTFEDFVWQYDYLPGTRLVSSITDIDGQSVSYDYDPLGRLEKSIARGGAIFTDYAYHYTNGPGDHNYVRAETTYDVVQGSEIEEMDNYQYFDGLGRLMQTVKVEYAPDLKDVVLGVEYDGAGRLTKEYIPVKSSGSGGAFYDIPSGTAAAVTGYEASPLNRVVSQAPAGGFETILKYGNNDPGEVDPGTGSYDDNKLYKQTAIDPNGNQVESFTEIIGRSVLSRKIGIDGLIGDTYSIYDDKDRVTMVIPPGATLSDDGLTYRYTYDAADNVLTKKIPDQALINLRYNDRDLMTLSQDGNMLAGGRWLHSKYDDYGRVTATGFVTGGNPDPNGNLYFAQQLTGTSYDGDLTEPIEIGKIVASSVINLGDGTWLDTEFNYDGFGRVQTTSGNNHLVNSPTAESISYSYDLADNVINQSRSHSGYDNLLINQNYTYDHSGRMIDAFHTVGSDPLDKVQISRNFYNERDFLIRKDLHKAPNGEFLQQINYTYNAAGWLTKINDVTDHGEDLADCGIVVDPVPCGPKCDYNLKIFCGEITEVIAIYGNGGQYVDLANYRYDCGEYQLLEQDLENWLTANGYLFQAVYVTQNNGVMDITILQTDYIFNYLEIWPPSGPTHGGDKVYFSQYNCTGSTENASPDICDICESFGYPCHKCPYEALQDPCATCQAIGIPGSCTNCDGTGDYCTQCQDLGYNDCTTCPLTVDVIHPLKLQIEYNAQDYSGGSYCSPILVTEISQYYHHDGTSKIEAYKKAGVVGTGTLSASSPVNYMEIDISNEWIKKDNVQEVIDSINVKVAAELGIAGIASSFVQADFKATVEEILLGSWKGLPTYEDEIADLPGYNPDLFALTLSYYNDNPISGAPKQFNGNISEMTWMVAGRAPQTYGFWYDGFDRVKKGKHLDALTGGGYGANNKYGTDYTYDLRGNILSLMRNGVDGTCTYPSGFSANSFAQIDNLGYTYTPGTNQLSFIQEASNKDYGFKGDGGSVAHDANGNMTDVDYKKMGVAYNYLNLPDLITDNINNSTIAYTYDAGGGKLKKEVTDALDPTASYIKDYVGGVEYKDNTLEAIYFEEGRVIRENGKHLYEYYLKDHLGNVRVVFSDKNNDGALQPFNNDGYPVPDEYSELLQENHYYPFGMNMDGPWTETENEPENRYLYNGKELNEDFGLDWLDYGARWYDASIGRFTTIDPLAESFPSWSPYHYVYNNPVLFTDPTGMAAEKEDWIDNGDGTYTAQAGDGAETLAQDAKISRDRAYEIMANTYKANSEGNNMGTYKDTDGVVKSKVDEGDIVIIPEQVEAIAENKAAIEKEEQAKITIEKNNTAIQQKLKTKDSLTRIKTSIDRDIKLSKDNKLHQPNAPDDPKGGLGIAWHLKRKKWRKESNKLGGGIDKLNNQVDSLKKVNESLKNE